MYLCTRHRGMPRVAVNDKEISRQLYQVQHDRAIA